MVKRKAEKLLIFLFFPSISGIIFGYFLLNVLEIPDIRELETLSPKPETRLYADDGTVFATLFAEKRIPISSKDMPDYLKKAFIAIEDVRFYEHSGIDIKGILRATYRNLVRRGLVEGGSTITQQLARNLFLTQKKSVKRKIEEMILAVQIERVYSKEEILTHYLNLVYLGEGAYGVEAAARKYFDKSTTDLTLEEAATLAALTKAPSSLSPFKVPKKVLERRNLVLKKMWEANFIREKEYLDAVQRTLNIAPFRVAESRAGYFVDYIKQSLDGYFGQDRPWQEGCHVYTTLSMEMTDYAVEAIKKGLESYKKRHPERKELPEVALIAIEVETGAIKVLIGGKNFSASPFNRAIQAKRQPGSAFKPFIYMAAIEKGFSPQYILKDTPVRYVDPWTGKIWEPKNYKNEYLGDVTMKKALAFSLNAATIRLLEQVGPEDVIELVKRMNVRGNFEPFLSLALGTMEVYPIDLASAFLVFARGGKLKKPYGIKSVSTIEGEEIFNIEKEREEEKQIFSEENTSILVSMMKEVIEEGTAKAASKLPYSLAGKTGTTDDYRDAWFVGFSPHLLCLVWIGYDKDITLGSNESGAVAALPIWIDFMSKALKMYPGGDFQFK